MTEKAAIIVHCFSERLPNGQWQAFSLRFGLAAQGESAHEVRAKLHAMVDDYLREAFGEDNEYCVQLLARKATWRVYVKYAWIRYLAYLGRPRRSGILFDEPFNSGYAHC
jgi:hypothetical protein